MMRTGSQLSGLDRLAQERQSLLKEREQVDGKILEMRTRLQSKP